MDHHIVDSIDLTLLSHTAECYPTLPVMVENVCEHATELCSHATEILINNDSTI